MKDIGIVFSMPTIMHCDNISIVSMSKDPILHSKNKHISIKYHFMREKIIENEIKLENVNT